MSNYKNRQEALDFIYKKLEDHPFNKDYPNSNNQFHASDGTVTSFLLWDERKEIDRKYQQAIEQLDLKEKKIIQPIIKEAKDKFKVNIHYHKNNVFWEIHGDYMPEDSDNKKGK